MDRGETAGARHHGAAHRRLGLPGRDGELDPNDPVVNTASEYMFQMATVAYHTLHGEQTVVLDEDFKTTASLSPPAPTCSRSTAATGPTSTASIRSRGGPAQAWTGVAQPDRRARCRDRHGLGPAARPRPGGPLRRPRWPLILTGAGLVWATRAEKVAVPVFRTAEAI